jgi:phosphoglycolate phosphatase-like HAD superfamily hydrolase
MAGHLLCEAFTLAPADVLYVGDAIFDFQFALNAGMDFVLFDNHGDNRLPGNMLNPVTSVARLLEIKSHLG